MWSEKDQSLVRCMEICWQNWLKETPFLDKHCWVIPNIFWKNLSIKSKIQIWAGWNCCVDCRWFSPILKVFRLVDWFCNVRSWSPKFPSGFRRRTPPILIDAPPKCWETGRKSLWKIIKVTNALTIYKKYQYI